MWTVYSSYTNKCVISEIWDRSLIISDMEYVSLLCPPPVFAVNEQLKVTLSPKPARVIPFCVLKHDNIYKTVITMDYLNRIRSHVKVKSINDYATIKKNIHILKIRFKWNKGYRFKSSVEVENDQFSIGSCKSAILRHQSQYVLTCV